ncbi:ATP-binding cassette domain-containing protein [Arthrobacter mobilis]|uniref:ABC transporter ATP-binding protein n=1 Tax=Arthrobacter mobilis TaxID=2724944 RepID=A0A7X6HDZ3_9MICC|nr:ABC transporter ATP-binding protein [Arthrobacter mobilis]NKX54231.1 ABC transporter ATP-binding protein [Arthrobacter mobilis]
MPEDLVIEHLHVRRRTALHFRGAQAASPAGSVSPSILSDVSLSVAPGEFVALVGGSGSGKTMTAMSILQLLPPQAAVDSGTIRLGGLDLTRATEAELNKVRGGRIGMLYQQPKRMFNPRKTIGAHLQESLKLHRGLRGRAAAVHVLDLLAEVGFENPAWCAQARAHQLSGGMAQRAMTALALAGQPDMLLADEPTSALDKVLERQILQLLDRERHERGLGILYITHNIATVSAFADRVVVMEAGQVRESGPAAAVLNAPQATYTKQLLEAAALSRGKDLPPIQQARNVLALDGVTKQFGPHKRRSRPVLKEVSFTLRQGEILGILGQSGSGKSTLARAIVGLEVPDGGTITRTLAAEPGKHAAAGTKVQLVFQEPHDSFDPRMKLLTSLEAPLRQRPDLTAEERRQRILEVMNDVELDSGMLDRYPGQCSGGQLQRATIARALLLEPEVLICDEATSALDALTQRKVLDLLLRLHRDRRLSLIMISHDLDVIRYMSHRVAVLFQGALVEVAETRDFFFCQQHEHSRKLVSAVLPFRGQAPQDGPRRPAAGLPGREAPREQQVTDQLVQ